MPNLSRPSTVKQVALCLYQADPKGFSDESEYKTHQYIAEQSGDKTNKNT